MLPIKIDSKIRSKVEDRKLLAKIKESKKTTTKKSNLIIDTIEDIRKDIEKNLGEFKKDYQCITTVEEFEKYIEKANEYGYIAIDTETTGLNVYKLDIVALCLYFPGEKVTYVPINHLNYTNGQRIEEQLTEEQIKPILDKLTAKVIMHNATYDIRVILHTIGTRLHCWWDTQEAAKLLNEEERHGLKILHGKYISHTKEKTFKDFFGNIKFQFVPIQYAYLYGAHDAIDTFELYEFQHKFINEDADRQDRRDLAWLYRNIEAPMIDVIVELEENGVAVDTEYLETLKVKYHSLLDKAAQHCINKINEDYGDLIKQYKQTNLKHKLEDPINLSSTDQIATLFYDILGEKPVDGKKARCVDGDVMNEFYAVREIEAAKYLIDYRSAIKLTSTYIDNIPDILAITNDGRVHTSFNSMGAKTGRMSSGDPINLQNIPSKNEDLRKMFIGQTTEREVEKREDNAYILKREEEVQLQDGTWVWAELVKVGDILESGEKVKAVKVKDFKVLIGV